MDKEIELLDKVIADMEMTLEELKSEEFQSQYLENNDVLADKIRPLVEKHMFSFMSMPSTSFVLPEQPIVKRKRNKPLSSNQ